MNTKVLLIDDDEDEQWIFSEALKEIDDSVDCVSAHNARQAIELLTQSSPDFVFLDVNMPGVNGLQLLEIIKKNDRLRHIPVIMYSTGISEMLTNAAMSKGALGCVKKENTITDLTHALKKFITDTVKRND